MLISNLQHFVGQSWLVVLCHTILKAFFLEYLSVWIYQGILLDQIMLMALLLQYFSSTVVLAALLYFLMLSNVDRVIVVPKGYIRSQRLAFYLLFTLQDLEIPPLFFGSCFQSLQTIYVDYFPLIHATHRDHFFWGKNQNFFLFSIHFPISMVSRKYGYERFEGRNYGWGRKVGR